MDRAWIDGRPVAIDAAIAEAARLLSLSRLPVIAGLDCDVLGAREAIALARRLGGACDYDHFFGMQPAIDAMRETGALVTTPNEARLRADMLLMVGARMGVDWPDIAERLMPPEGSATERRMVWLCPDDCGRTGDTARQYGRVLGERTADLPALIAALRARVAGRPVDAATLRLTSPPPPPPPRRVQGAAAGKARPRSKPGPTVAEIDALASELKAAKFGVAVWAPRDLDALATEMLFGLIDDLNAHTRFAGVPLWRTERGPGVAQACGWLTGFPPPVGFGRGKPEHDAWRFDSERLVESGEADCVLWISVFSQLAPWEPQAPDVVIGFHRIRQDLAEVHRAHVYIGAGCPGIDHDGVLYDLDTGTIAPEPAVDPTDAPSVAEILARIAAALPERAPC
jgi:formylmethanofuran dehydrogenase subunit B